MNTSPRLHLVSLMLMVEVIRLAAYLNPFSSASKFCSGLWLFISKNVREEGVNKKTVRFFDTLGELLFLNIDKFGSVTFSLSLSLSLYLSLLSLLQMLVIKCHTDLEQHLLQHAYLLECTKGLLTES